MNKRFFLALVLTAVVIIVTPLVFQGSARKTDTSNAIKPDTASHSTVQPTETARVAIPSMDSATRKLSRRPTETATTLASARTDTSVVRTARATYTFSGRGAAPLGVVLDSFVSRRPVGGLRTVQLVDLRHALARYQLALGRDTIALDTIAFQAVASNTVAGPLGFAGEAAGHSIRIDYSFAHDVAEEYLFQAKVGVAGAPAGSSLIVNLPEALLSNEPDTLDDINHLAISYRPAKGDVSSVGFSKLDTTEVRLAVGPINWVAERNKYFLVAIRGVSAPFAQLRMLGAPRTGKVAGEAYAAASLPLAGDGSAVFDMYAGPQSFERLRRLGGDFDQVNPYAGWLHGVVQPFATIVMRALLWMKRTTQLNYGWVLVLFGITIRLVLWPLNQSAMRTSMKMQRLQPELQAIQKKYSDDPKRQQEAIMKVYKDHGMSPLSPLMGCLPMLLPMPVLFALYYVFQNTIEFRGVPFLWLPDISLRDPFYITPLLMGISMFVMSWIGMRNSPPNPQAKMMSYMMPVMLTVLFLNFASGLNLYYAVQNVAAIPQQWLLARERAKEPASNPAPVNRRA